ncbi:BREX system P-loop protein BrxC [Aequorivita sp. KMM 9714]|uniref:BREX system P-loop protein BrxC n=1 Tax=Aequorivita sp. KMM 9714 TaxID=2707173 RepID=UPI0013E9F609|nr:BREX system P-loop protein BrxC [Aequorivita sp. KMM 9714]NGX85341.1 BREX system P-loop protein BrxC [Aequorivita sp. KMM 9714]
MKTIKDILKLDLNEDIKNVINLEDKSHDEIQSEIESYIITDGLGKHLSKFISEYTGNLKETGVWLSGFYGSGKSYFGKMLGYLIENPIINGTSARDRFIPRLAGVANQSIIENNIRKLDSIKSNVIFLDVAKQNTDNGLAFTLFSNFLKKLGFREDRYGYMEYDLFIDDKYEFLQEKAKELFGKEWDEIKKSNREIAKVMRRIYSAMDYTDAEFADTQNTYSFAIKNFDAGSFKVELEKYINKFQDENLVFVFDEASEAISQNKFNLLDLEGLAESLSSIQNKVWTIAIAQEKLDSVITNANAKKSQLTKVTDRFKTKIHLESTEVDVIIRNRLLLKKNKSFTDLLLYYKNNDGLVSDVTNLKSSFPTKTESAEQFATYYPFHKYQFDLLQKFLFSSNALAASQVAARGMIITTFDVLKKVLRDRELYKFTTSHDLCENAQAAPPVDLVNKYSLAESIVKNKIVGLNGEKLMKTLHFINESELASPTIENITKAYIEDISTYYDVKPKVEAALNLLVEAKILLLSNNNYKITSNLEGKLLEEMKDFDVELFIKKRELVSYLKKLSIFRQVALINEDSVAYNFNILTDLDDEIIASNNRNLRLTVYSLFNINEDRQDFIEGLKLDTQYTKELITLVPDNSSFSKIDKLLDEVKRYGYMEEKYANDDDANKRQIIREFVIIKEEKEKDLLNLIEAAYTNGSVIYLFDENLLNKDSFKGSINEIQRKLIKNIYTKRLSSQLSEAIGTKLVTETNDEKLHKYFSGDEFKFFDTKGNFTGDHLKIIEEITAKFKSRYIDGKSLEEELSIAPWGYSYGTISTALAVLFRAGRLVIKHNDTEYFSYTDRAAHEVFTSSTKFRSARYKSITKSLSASQKNELIQTLLDLDFEKHTDKKLGWNVSDFEASNAITQLAEHFITSLNVLKNTQEDFDRLFSKVGDKKDILQRYTAKTTEANYIEKAEDFLNSKEEYRLAIKAIVKAEKFIKKNLSKINGFQRFVVAVNRELQKAGIQNTVISSKTDDFNAAMKTDVIEKFQDIQSAAQAIKDAYYDLMSENAVIMSNAYKTLKSDIEVSQHELKSNYPSELNKSSAQKLLNLLEYASNKIVDGVRLEYHTECQISKYSLSDILNYIDLAPSKDAELQMIKNSFLKEEPKKGEPKQPKKLQLGITKKVMSAGEYRKLLAAQIQAMAGMPDDEEVEVTLNN